MKTKLTNEIIDKRLENRNIKRISDYKGSNEYMKFLCLVPSCDYAWIAKPRIVAGKDHKNTGCPKCGKNIKYTNNSFDEKLSNKNIKRMDDLINVETKIRFQCLKCNNIWKTKPSNILQDYGCPECAGTNKLTNEILDTRLLPLYIKRLDNYKNSYTKIHFQCLKCNNIWKTKPTVIFEGSRCPECCSGKFENHVKQLIQNNFTFDKIYKKCFKINGHNRFPDFIIQRKNKPDIIIEVNGGQHYKPVKFSKHMSQEKAIENFKKQQIRDIEVNDYFKSKNIPIIWIKYNMNDNEIIENIKKFI